MQVELTQRNPSRPITDGQHYHLKCQDCNAPLFDVWNTQPEIKSYTHRVKAKCPHCDGYGCSETVVFEGGYFHYGTEENPYTEQIKLDYELDRDKKTVVVLVGKAVRKWEGK